MGFTLSSILTTLILFAAMVTLGELGRRGGRWRALRDPKGAFEGGGVIDGAIFALLGLIIAFTFSGAASRFDARRTLIVEEANAIGTAYLRLDLLPSDARPALQNLFRQYVDSRLQMYRQFPDVEAARAELKKDQHLQNEIWSRALAAAQGSQPATMLLVPALNQMFDITTTRWMAVQMHPPPTVFAMLFALALIASVVAGYHTARSDTGDWLRMVGFAAVTSLVFFVIHDMEFPRFGLIRLDAFDRVLVDVREAMT
jgi:hypothetical protein